MGGNDDAKALVSQAMAALGTGDAAALVALLAPGASLLVQGNTAISGVFRGNDAIIEWFAAIAPRIASVEAESLLMLQDGEWVVTRDRISAETVTGRMYRNDYLRMWRCRGGQIHEIVEYLDTEAVTQTLLAD